MYPTADQVAVAIIAAFREAGLSPKVAEIIAPKTAVTVAVAAKLKQARGYTALALHELFPQCPGPAVGRMVGARKPGAYLSLMVTFRRKGTLPWYDAEAFCRVVEAVANCDGAVTQEPPLTDKSIARANLFDICRGEALETPAPGPQAGEEPPIDLPPLPKGRSFGTLPASPRKTRFEQLYDGGARRRSAEEEIRRAILNTGGRLAEE